MRYSLFLIMLAGAMFGQPSKFEGLSNSTANWTPYPPSSMPAWGGTYTTPGGYHTLNGSPMQIHRIPPIASTCPMNVYNPGNYYHPGTAVSYSGTYYIVDYAAGVYAHQRVTIATNTATASGRVLSFSSTASLWANVGYAVTGTNIPAGTTLVSFTATSVTLSADVTGAGVASGASITFTNSPPLTPWKAVTQAEACLGAKTYPSYSMRPAFNSDNSVFYVLGGHALSATFYRNTSPPELLFTFKDDSLASTNANETWSHTNPNEMFYMADSFVVPPQMKKLTINPSATPPTYSISTYYTFDITGTDCPVGTKYIRAGGSGNPSMDDRYWALACAASTLDVPSRIIIFDTVQKTVVSKRDVTDICGGTVAIDWLGMAPKFPGAVVAWKSSTREDIWHTCQGVELFDRDTLASKGMLVPINGHNETGIDTNGDDILVAPLPASITGETTFDNGSIHVVRMKDVHPPPYGTTTGSSYVRRWKLPCSFYGSTAGSDPYTGCNLTGVGVNTTHTSGRAAETPAYYGYFLLSTLSESTLTESAGWGRSENVILGPFDGSEQSAFTLVTNASTAAGNAVLHFASSSPSGGLYTPKTGIAGHYVFLPGTKFQDNTYVASYDATSITLSAPVTASISSGTTIWFYRRAPFRRISRTVAQRLNQNTAGCTSGADYFQEPHSTVSRDFSRILFASSWLTQCGQVSTFYVDIPDSGGSIPMTVTPMSQDSPGYPISWTVHNPAAGFTWSISPADCAANAGSGSGDGATISTQCETPGAHTLSVNDGATTVSPAFTITPYPALAVAPGSVDTDSCTPRTFVATGGSGSYSWSAPNGTPSSGTGASFTAKFSASTTVTLIDTTTARTIAVPVTVGPCPCVRSVGVALHGVKLGCQ